MNLLPRSSPKLSLMMDAFEDSESTRRMETRHYTLQDGVFVGLKEQLEDIHVARLKRVPLRGCSKPEVGKSLKEGNFVPVLENRPTGSGRTSAALYREEYICATKHSSNKKRRRSDNPEEQLQCSFLATVEVSRIEPTTCVLKYPAEHACDQNRAIAANNASANPSPLSETVRDILISLQELHFDASTAYHIVKLSEHLLKRIPPHAAPRETILPEGIVVPPNMHYVLPTGRSDDILRLPLREREPITLRAVQIFFDTNRKRTSKTLPTSNADALSKIRPESLWLDEREIPTAGALEPYHIVIGTKHLELLKPYLQSCVLGFDGTWLSKDRTNSAILSLVLVEQVRRRVFQIALDITVAESEPCAKKFLETVKAKVEEVIGEPWVPHFCTIDKSPALRNAFEYVFKNTKMGICTFHAHRAIQTQVLKIAPESTLVNAHSFNFRISKLGLGIIDAFKLVKLSRSEEEFAERKRTFLYDKLTSLVTNPAHSAAMQGYFIRYWFCDLWEKHWVNYMLNNGYMDHVEWGTNNHAESMFGKFKGLKTNRRDGIPTNMAKVIGYCHQHITSEDSVAGPLLDSTQGARNMRWLRNSPLVAHAGALQEKVVRPMLKRNISIHGENGEITLRYQDREVQIRGDERTNVLVNHSQKLNTKSGETHCECAEMNNHNGRPCKHWLAWWIISYKTQGVTISNKDWRRMLNFMRLLAKEVLDRTSILTTIGTELDSLDSHNRVPDSESTPPMEISATDESWLPWSVDGTCILPVRADQSLLNCFLVSMFAAFDVAQVAKEPEDNSPVFCRFIEAQSLMKERAYARMWNLWNSRVNVAPENNTDALKSMLMHLCGGDDVTLGRILCGGYIFSCLCTQSGTCPAHGRIGVWANASEYQEVMFLPALPNTINEIVQLGRANAVSSELCHSPISIAAFANLYAGHKKYFEQGTGSSETILCKGIRKYVLNSTDRHNGPILIVACKDYFAQSPSPPEISKEIRHGNVSKSLVAVIGSKTDGSALAYTTWFRTSSADDSHWYSYDGEQRAGLAGRVPVFISQRALAQGYSIDLLLFVQTT